MEPLEKRLGYVKIEEPRHKGPENADTNQFKPEGTYIQTGYASNPEMGEYKRLALYNNLICRPPCPPHPPPPPRC